MTGNPWRPSTDPLLQARSVEGLEHDLRHALAVGFGVQRGLRQQHRVLLRGHAQLVVEGVVPDLLLGGLVRLLRSRRGLRSCGVLQAGFDSCGARFVFASIGGLDGVCSASTHSCPGCDEQNHTAANVSKPPVWEFTYAYEDLACMPQAVRTI